MPLWGTAHADDDNKPKFLPANEDSDYNKAECYATNAGWVIDGAATGNGNTSADPEVLVAIRGLAGVSATTGLKTATITSFRFHPGTAAATDHTAGSSSQTVRIQITWDEAITVTGAPTVVVANDTDADHTCAYVSGTGTNRLVFQVASQTLTAGAVMTIGGSNDIVLAGGTLKDQGATPANASQDMGNVTAVTHTVVA